MIIRQISMVHCCLREIIEQFFMLEESPVTLRSAVKHCICMLIHILDVYRYPIM